MDELKAQLEDTYHLIKKANDNFKKCPKARKTVAYIKVRTQCIDEYWVSYKTTHIALIKILTPEQKVQMKVSIYYDSCEELYLSLKTDMQEALELLTGTNLANTSNASSSNSDGYRSVDVRLPRIDLPKFTGNYEEWQTFEDTFTSLIHNNKALSDVQKLHYLKSCLSGEASATLKYYQITDDNYQPACKTLKARYSHKRLIVNAILKRLFSQKKVLTQSPSQLRIFIDTTRECMNGLDNLKIETKSWDPVIIFLAMQKLDIDSHKEWEDYVSKEHSVELPELCDLYTFLENRIHTLELTTTTSKPTRERVFSQHTSCSTPSTSSIEKFCAYCKENHALCHCKKFCTLKVDERSDFVKNQGLCFNCLLSGHSVHICKQRISCKVCGRRHHSLLHQIRKQETSGSTAVLKSTAVSNHTNVEEEVNKLETQQVETAAVSSYFTMSDSPGLLATALVPVRNESGMITILRALVDQGSQVTLISERAAQLLKVRRTPVKGSITGTGSTKTKVSQATFIEILSRWDNKFKLKTKAYIMSTQLTSMLPRKSVITSTWSHINGLFLADPNYSQPGRIDLLLGSKVYAKIIKDGLIKGLPNTPCAQNTSLGWILFGDCEEIDKEELISMHHCLDLDNMLKGMWEVELSEKRVWTEEEKLCEELYKKTYSRTKNGRYIVKLPMKINQPLSLQGDTRNIALKRLYQLERRLQKEEDLKTKYAEVVNEYLQLNHMEEVPEDEKYKLAVYLPHHAVIRNDKETTKLRVVFDASSKGSNNISLNEEMLVGPQLQEDLRNLVMRWRTKRVCFVADVQKMYRQVLVTKEDTDYQRILWRDDPNAEVKDYRLLRVTFGTASAPYLAVRTLMQIADDEGKEYPVAAKIIKEDCFMDDLMSGLDSPSEAITTANDIKAILLKGGFILQKWASNNSEFMQHMEPTERSSKVNIDINIDGTIKALGLTWNIGEDVFEYNFNMPPISESITKRNILADIQRLFDPLGWLAPAIVTAKMMIQKLWLQGIGWDEEVDRTITEEWVNIRNSFDHLKKIKINRWLNTKQTKMNTVSIHGFCDASAKAYAAVVYIRVQTDSGEIKTSLLAARTKVAPVKPVSLPRLELCGAVLLSQLLKRVREALRLSNDQVFAWTDSTVVLAWLIGSPGRWNVFVSNRVVEILENTGNQRWYHVNTKDNPADVASRGQLLPQLILNRMWWEGPAWLQTPNIPEKGTSNYLTNLEQRKCFTTNVHDDKKEKTKKFEHFETLIELQRVVVHAVRFLKHMKAPETENKDKLITTMELEDALFRIIRIIQNEEFNDEIQRLKANKLIKNKSKLHSLNPMLDENTILRVGGRLRHSNLTEDSKHPIIIGHNNSFVLLLIADAHKRTLHGGVQLTMTFLRSRYWVLGVKSLVRSYIHNCLICSKQRAIQRDQIMGDLPKCRVTQARPFLHAGVDFAGPLHVLTSRNRGAKCTKAYISLFVCMATKALHLELVSDLSSECFLNAFQRFVSRRGKCSHLWSDRGTNFVGANKELAELWHAANLEIPGHLVDILARDGTQWHFIPPYSPNFGGLWEAGVKSVKFHLKRILNTNLTFEELTTVLCQIEAVLNSRPLCPIDPNDTDNLEILTPGHFLIGEAPTNVPIPDLTQININRLSRWQMTQRIVQNFWHRWHTEYLTRLQERPKWQRRAKEFQIGDIVLLKDENLPPGKWALGRIVEKHPGHDNICRVYSVRCHGKIIKRSVSKICELPINNVD